MSAVVVGAAFLISTAVSAAPEKNQVSTPVTPVAKHLSPKQARMRATGCKKLYTRKQHRGYVSAVYRSSSVVTKAEHHNSYMRTRCQHSERSERISRAKWHREMRRRKHRKKKELAFQRAITPYDCGSAGHFAIPCSIISCESGFSWSAANPSGAIGPYQLLGWGAPWPANSVWARTQHHIIAARVWAGGAGRGNWVC